MLLDVASFFAHPEIGLYASDGRGSGCVSASGMENPLNTSVSRLVSAGNVFLRASWLGFVRSVMPRSLAIKSTDVSLSSSKRAASSAPQKRIDVSLEDDVALTYFPGRQRALLDAIVYPSFRGSSVGSCSCSAKEPTFREHALMRRKCVHPV